MEDKLANKDEAMKKELEKKEKCLKDVEHKVLRYKM